MQTRLFSSAAAICGAALFLTLSLPSRADVYTLGPDSQRQPGVPQGTVTKYTWTSKIFPGTVRDYWIYVPAQYRKDKPACLMVFQDGGGYVSETGSWRVPVVFDNLISKGDMPVTIAVLINPGVLPALTAGARARYNRSFEYDALGGQYARFLLDEILPEVSRQYNISSDPNDRAISGASSGGSGAFTVAWNHPESFHRVLSFIGSFTDLRGDDIYPALIRKSEPKPLRVFLQDGSNDLNIYAGSWYLANQGMESALQFAGYDTKFAVGTEGHNGKHGGAILPDALRWLWRDYPKPIVNSPVEGNERHFIAQVLEPGSGWEVVKDGLKFADGPAVDRYGNVYFSDIGADRIYKAATDGKVTMFKENAGKISGMMFGADGRLYACQNGRKRVIAIAPDGTDSVLASDVPSNDLAVTKDGGVYFTDSPNHQVWYIPPHGERRVVYKGIALPNGIRLSPDQSLLTVDDYDGRWIWSFQVQPDGSLANGEAFYRLEAPDESAATNADGMTYDNEGYLYVVTKTGIQICDQPGRVVAIINSPQPGPLVNIVFGGLRMNYLYVAAGDKVLRRRTTRTGVRPGEAVEPPVPHL